MNPIHVPRRHRAQQPKKRVPQPTRLSLSISLQRIGRRPSHIVIIPSIRSNQHNRYNDLLTTVTTLRPQVPRQATLVISITSVLFSVPRRHKVHLLTLTRQLHRQRNKRFNRPFRHLLNLHPIRLNTRLHMKKPQPIRIPVNRTLPRVPIPNMSAYTRRAQRDRTLTPHKMHTMIMTPSSLRGQLCTSQEPKPQPPHPRKQNAFCPESRRLTAYDSEVQSSSSIGLGCLLPIGQLMQSA